MKIIIFLLTGLAAGYLAGLIRKGSGFGLIGNLVVGVGGAFIGGFMVNLIGFRAYGVIAHIVSALIGALVLLWLLSLIKK